MTQSKNFVLEEEKEVADATASNKGEKELDLRQNYQAAVECLVQCEAIIDTLQKSLLSKDERIAALEEKIVKMSFELASSKAFEDEHRSKRRGPRRVSSEEDDEGSFIDGNDDSLRSGIRKNDANNYHVGPPSTHNKGRQRQPRRNSHTHNPWPSSLGSMSLDSFVFGSTGLDDSDTKSSLSSTSPPGINNGSSSFSLGKFFRGGSMKEEPARISDDYEIKEEEKGGEGHAKSENNVGISQDSPGKRRPPNKRRMIPEELKSSFKGVENGEELRKLWLQVG